MCQYAEGSGGGKLTAVCQQLIVQFWHFNRQKVSQFQHCFMAPHVVPVAGNSFTAGDGNPKVLAAVKSGAFKLKLQAKQTAAGRDCLGLELGLAMATVGLWDCGTNEKRAKWQCENCA